MSARQSLRRLAQPVAHADAAAGATAAPSGTSYSLAPLLQFPAFHPIPFAQDKFLSIKSRSLETYTKLRGDVLHRSSELRQQLQRLHDRAARQEQLARGDRKQDAISTTTVGSSSEPTPLPLTPRQAEELLLLNKKVESLTDAQGFVLSDEMVWRMFHLCVECGAPQQAIQAWLQKHILAEKRGPPYPLFLLEDLTTVLRTSVLPRLPESGASLFCGNSVFSLGGGHAEVLEDGVFAAQRMLQRRAIMDIDGGAEPERGAMMAAATAAVSPFTQSYASHTLHAYVWPIWQSLEAMELVFAALRKEVSAEEGERDTHVRGSGDGESSIDPSSHNASPHASHAAWLPDAAEQTRVVRATLMSVTPLSSFSPRAGSNGSPPFANDVDVVVAPLRALLDLWLVLAQCASEAKDTRLLLEVQGALCRGFLTAPHGGSTGSAGMEERESVTTIPVVNESAWCLYSLSPNASKPAYAKEMACRTAAAQEARSMVHTFVSGTLAVLQYGLLCAEQEAALWQLHDGCALVMGTAATLHSLRASGEDDAVSTRSIRESTELSLTPPASHVDRSRALAAAQAESAEAQATHLLRVVLPVALQSTARAAYDGSERNDVAAMKACTHAFVSHALQTCASSTSEGADTAAAYAEAGLYVGFAAGDVPLLQEAATRSALSEPEVRLLHLTARALQNHRRAVMQLSGQALDASPDTAEEIWAGMQQWRDSSTRGNMPGTVPSQQQMKEGYLQTLLLCTASRQAAIAAAYAQAVETSAHDGNPETGMDSEERDGSAVENVASQGGFARAEAEEQRRADMEHAWTQLHKSTTQNIRGALQEVHGLLHSSKETSSSSGEAGCLSPSALSSVAVLARMGFYVERNASKTASEGTAASEEKTTASAHMSVIDDILARVASDTCLLLHNASASASSASSSSAMSATSAVVGTWVQWVLVALMTRRDWAQVLRVLTTLDGTDADGQRGTPSLLCSATLDPTVFAALYARAQEDGAASVCAFLRPRRASLFF